MGAASAARLYPWPRSPTHTLTPTPTCTHSLSVFLSPNPQKSSPLASWWGHFCDIIYTPEYSVDQTWTFFSEITSLLHSFLLTLLFLFLLYTFFQNKSINQLPVPKTLPQVLLPKNLRCHGSLIPKSLVFPGSWPRIRQHSEKAEENIPDTPGTCCLPGMCLSQSMEAWLFICKSGSGNSEQDFQDLVCGKV